ncbi:protein disulfide isomerase-like 1-3 [Pistacia vera]|uniref:protein disulfide isomerase-like 1-3 n=1 Tax=Pistacia vera TaxID=55513 RepID=UPI001262CA8A|nr:protein disulfide isomerase-like 1-3 [Pistacia vera]
MPRATKVFLILYTIVLLLITIHWFSPFYLLNFDQENSLLQLTDEKDVVILSEKNFSHVVANNRYVMVDFFAPWSYYSQQLAPEYALAARQLKGKVMLAKVNAYEERGLKRKYRAQGHPNVYFFAGGVKIDSYTNARKRDAIVKWTKTKIALGVYTITSIEQAEQLLMAQFTTVLAFMDSLQGQDSEELAAASKMNTDVLFYQTTAVDVAKAFQFDQEIKIPALILLEKESQHLSHFYGPFTKYAIANFVYVNKLPPESDDHIDY